MNLKNKIWKVIFAFTFATFFLVAGATPVTISHLEHILIMICIFAALIFSAHKAKAFVWQEEEDDTDF